MDFVGVGLAFIGVLFGLMNLYLPNLVWRLHAWRYRWEDITAERTPQWEATRRLVGIVSLLFGIGYIVLGVCAALT